MPPAREDGRSGRMRLTARRVSGQGAVCRRLGTGTAKNLSATKMSRPRHFCGARHLPVGPARAAKPPAGPFSVRRMVWHGVCITPIVPSARESGRNGILHLTGRRPNPPWKADWFGVTCFRENGVAANRRRFFCLRRFCRRPDRARSVGERRLSGLTAQTRR